MEALRDWEPRERARFLDDVLSLVIQSGCLGLTQTDLMNGLRNNVNAWINAWIVLESGRRWKGLPPPTTVLFCLEDAGFNVTQGRRTGGGYVTRVSL
jgi:hypothetical protein